MIASISNTNAAIYIKWHKREASTFPAIWLRDNCRCAHCRHSSSGQRLYKITDLSEDLEIQEVVLLSDNSLRITWALDNHVTTFSEEWLIAHDLTVSARANRKPLLKFWDNRLSKAMPKWDWNQMLAEEAVELDFLNTYHAYGFALIKNSPSKSETVLTIGNRLGFVRVTNYGAYFDVLSVPNPTNLAYTSIGLGAHSDNPYRDPTPGVQLLHCITSDAPGGDSLLVDGFRAASILREEDRAAFELLTRVPVNFTFRSSDTELMARQTLISVDEDGDITGVHFNNRSLDWLDAPVEVIEPWFNAYRKFAEILRRPEGEVIFRLEPGDCLVMQNDRALHGRTDFDPSRGLRHLQGCYIDKDGLNSRARVLRRILTPKKEAAA